MTDTSTARITIEFTDGTTRVQFPDSWEILDGMLSMRFSDHVIVVVMSNVKEMTIRDH
jgi:hypothetical protein